MKSSRVKMSHSSGFLELQLLLSSHQVVLSCYRLNHQIKFLRDSCPWPLPANLLSSVTVSTEYFVPRLNIHSLILILLCSEMQHCGVHPIKREVLQHQQVEMDKISPVKTGSGFNLLYFSLLYIQIGWVGISLLVCCLSKSKMEET